jgi:MEMO1 family protein
MIRQPAVAGQFYERNASSLLEDVKSRLDPNAVPAEAFACVCPHAGYVYSGDVAGATLSAVAIPKTVIVLSFSHRGIGEHYAVWPDGAWNTPLGDVPVDADLAAKLLAGSSLLKSDTQAFACEHSGEVMLPLLQVLRPDVQVVMVSVYPFAPLHPLQTLGREMAEALKDADPRPLLVASTDMTHHRSAPEAERMDRLAIDAMLKLDEAELHTVVQSHDISMCGVCPVTATMACAKALGAKTARLVRYENSGKATGDVDSVVAYAGLVFT